MHIISVSYIKYITNTNILIATSWTPKSNPKT